MRERERGDREIDTWCTQGEGDLMYRERERNW